MMWCAPCTARRGLPTPAVPAMTETDRASSRRAGLQAGTGSSAGRDARRRGGHGAGGTGGRATAGGGRLADSKAAGSRAAVTGGDAEPARTPGRPSVRGPRRAWRQGTATALHQLGPQVLAQTGGRWSAREGGDQLGPAAQRKVARSMRSYLGVLGTARPGAARRGGSSRSSTCPAGARTTRRPRRADAGLLGPRRRWPALGKLSCASNGEIRLPGRDVEFGNRVRASRERPSSTSRCRRRVT